MKCCVKNAVLRILLLLIPTFGVGYSRRCGCLYKSIVFFIARRASLGLGQPEVKPSTPEPMPGKLKEPPGKLRWMKWEPNLAEDARWGGGGHEPLIPTDIHFTFFFPFSFLLPHYFRFIFFK